MYLDLHKLWVTAGSDYNLRTWDFQSDEAEDKKKIHETSKQLAHLK